jgi:hypothetical protein
MEDPYVRWHGKRKVGEKGKANSRLEIVDVYTGYWTCRELESDVFQ